MVHVGMRDEDVAHPQKLAGRQTRDVADVKQDRPPLELQVDEYPRVAERPVDQRRVENGPHLAENTIRGPSEFARQPQWGERISAGNSTAAAESVNTNAESRTTRPAGADASPAHNFRSAAALSAPVTSHKRCRAASSTLKV